MSSRLRTILALLAVAAVLVILFVVFRITSQVSTLPDSTRGNTSANLYNNGLFCESDGKVYFANPYDNNSLYSMNPDETDMKRLVSSSAKFINAGGKYVVFYTEGSSGGSGLGYVRSAHGVYRINQSGSSSVALTTDPCTMVLLAGNNVYYQRYDVETNTTNYRMTVNKRDKKQLTDDYVTLAEYQNGQLYYNGVTGDHHLYALNTANDMIQEVWGECNMWFPVLRGNEVYYLDLDTDYSLCRYNLSDGSVTTLCNDRVVGFNFTDSYIYYNKEDGENSALMRMRYDGSGQEVVASGTYTNINVTSRYVYFYPYGSSLPCYKTPADGPVQVTGFDAAAAFVMQE
ncbi:MAG: DUF5050 domain-containing protein [Lachnospiraceae bacterium]|nr:DUF5050 domain-containing protein [Lachnospiraceae bacterium]